MTATWDFNYWLIGWADIDDVEQEQIDKSNKSKSMYRKKCFYWKSRFIKGSNGDSSWKNNLGNIECNKQRDSVDSVFKRQTLEMFR